MTKNWKSLYSAIGLAIIPLIGLLFVLRSEPIMTGSVREALFGLILIYIATAHLTGPLENGQWAGHVGLSAFVGWLISGLNGGLLVVCLGTVASSALHMWQRKHSNLSSLLQEAFGRIAIHGNGILIAHVITLQSGNHLPLQSIGMSTESLWILAFAILLATIGQQFIGLVIMQVHPQTHLQRVSPQFMLEAIIIVQTIMIGLSFLLGLGTFVALLLLTLGVAYWDQKAKNAVTILSDELDELNQLNLLGQRISRHLNFDDVFDNLYQEVRQLVQADTLYITIYDDDHQILRFLRAYQNGELRQWPSRPLGNKIVDHVIRSRQPITLLRSEERRIRRLNIDSETLNSEVYCGLPLFVGDKLMGGMVVARTHSHDPFTAHDIDLLNIIANQASLALRNATLYERSTSLANNLSLINASLQDVMFNLDQGEAMGTACKMALDVMKAQGAAIYLIQDDGKLELVHAIGFTDPGFEQSMPFPPTHFEEDIYIVSNIEQSNNAELKSFAERANFNALMQIVLNSGNTVVGYLAIYHEQTHYFDATERNLLMMLANQITTALGNADLLQTLELYASEQAQLVHLSRISTSNLDLERIIHDMHMMLTQMLELDHVEIGLHQIDAEKLQLYRSAPEPNRGNLESHEMLRGDIPEIDALLDSDDGKMQTIDDYSDISAALRSYLSELNIRTCILIPMRINDQNIGLLVLASSKSRTFNANDIRLVEMATYQIAAQIHNARIYRLTEEALVQRLEQLAFIEEITQQISQELDLDVIIKNVLDAATQVTQAEFAALALIKPAQKHYYDCIAQESVDGEINHYQLTLYSEHGVVGRVIKTGEMLMIPDTQSYEAYSPFPDLKHIYRSVIAVPLLKGEQIIGVLNLESTRPNFFTSEQASFIHSLAGHTAISLTNASLLDEREHQITTLSHLRDLSLEALKAVEQHQISEAIPRTASQILRASISILYRYVPEEDSLRVAGAVEFDSGTIKQLDAPVVPTAIIRKALEENSIQVIEDTTTHPLYIEDGQKNYAHLSALAIPIHRPQGIQEILFLGFDERRTIELRDLDTLDLLSVQASSHLENVTLNEALRNSNTQMRAILDSTRDGIILLNREGRIQDANLMAEQLLGFRIRNYTGASFVAVSQQSAPPDHMVRDIATRYETAPDELNTQEYSYEGQHIKTFLTTVHDAQENMIGQLLILRDISEERSLADFRQKVQSMVLHDLRGPLGAIISSMYLAISLVEFPGDDPLEVTLLPTLQASLSSANNLLSMVDTLHDLPNLSEMEIIPKPVDLRDLVEKAHTSLAAMIQSAEIEVVFNFDDDLPPVNGDANLIRRVLVNILHNAYKFTPERGQIRIDATQNGYLEDFVEVQISDSGPGIPEDQRERIFEEFTQIEGQRPRTGKGIGLGLNFCKLAVEAHGGKIWIEDHGPLSGACFAFTLPITAPDHESSEKPGDSL